MSADRFAVLLNAAGGSADEEVREKVRIAFDEAGVEYRLYAIEGDPADMARQAVEDGWTALVAGGGDGSVGAVAGIAVAAGVVFGVLPMGTLNHFARDLGIAEDPVEAVAVLTGGHRRRIDVGRVGDTVFVNNASVGAYARIVARRESLEDRMGKWAAAMAAVRSVFPNRSVRLILEIDGERLRLDSTIVLFGNNEYIVEGGRFTRTALDRGVLSVYALRAEHVWDVARIAFRIARDNLGRERALVHRTGRSVRLVAPGPTVLVAHDGEVASFPSPLDIVVEQAVLEVLAPQTE